METVDDEILDILLLNARVPEERRGDYFAQISACRLGERRLERILIVAALQRTGAAVTAAAVDQLLWNRGQEPRYKAVPRHRSRCTAY